MKTILKRSFLLVCVLLLAISLIACEAEQSNNVDDGKGDENSASEDTVSFAVIYQNVTIELGKPAQEILAELGDPFSVQEVFDCGEGNSRVLYQFSSFALYTMKTKDGDEVIDQVELFDDLSTTEEGIAIGSKESAVRDAYGKPVSEKDGILTYSEGEHQLMIELADGKVSAIGLLRKTK